MRGETSTGCSTHRLSGITLSGDNVRVDVRGWSWGEMLANIQDELDVQLRDEEGTLITVSRAPGSRNRWLIYRDQVLIGSARRRWYRSWSGYSAEGELVLPRVRRKWRVVRALLERAGH